MFTYSGKIFRIIKEKRLRFVIRVLTESKNYFAAPKIRFSFNRALKQYDLRYALFALKYIPG